MLTHTPRCNPQISPQVPYEWGRDRVRNGVQWMPRQQVIKSKNTRRTPSMAVRGTQVRTVERQTRAEVYHQYLNLRSYH